MNNKIFLNNNNIISNYYSYKLNYKRFYLFKIIELIKTLYYLKLLLNIEIYDILIS